MTSLIHVMTLLTTGHFRAAPEAVLYAGMPDQLAGLLVILNGCFAGLLLIAMVWLIARRLRIRGSAAKLLDVDPLSVHLAIHRGKAAGIALFGGLLTLVEKRVVNMAVQEETLLGFQRRGKNMDRTTEQEAALVKGMFAASKNVLFGVGAEPPIQSDKQHAALEKWLSRTHLSYSRRFPPVRWPRLVQNSLLAVMTAIMIFVYGTAAAALILTAIASVLLFRAIRQPHHKRWPMLLTVVLWVAGLNSGFPAFTETSYVFSIFMALFVLMTPALSENKELLETRAAIRTFKRSLRAGEAQVAFRDDADAWTARAIMLKQEKLVAARMSEGGWDADKHPLTYVTVHQAFSVRYLNASMVRRVLRWIR
ncbi:hypothetical protein [Jeotgalibacillus sp. R-1-5s-1]|uniref:hypothetical protein n=1 Tax=Jeotgalibacillus sp. R-1-5s-1 TaxID=2555897 RepID=UPI00106D7DC1|nr:hypothetical protein [Jeotgalibacillus sp. R-1-5s-1]TFD94310.1 hypothetical protein E2491_12750 [Jeotgalibacillus sp. R-1-5s-1]